MDRRPIVKTIGLTKVFKDFWMRDRVVAVADLNFEVYPGEVFGLLGPNGSGKSTTIKMLLGLLYPTRGRISVFGRPPTDVAVKSRIGYLPEESYLYRFLNAKETLNLYGRLFEQSGAVRGSRISKLLEMVGLQHQARRRMGEYSKGMARRIGLAQALINDPDFLILDEPTTGMDPIGTAQIKELIRELAKRGKTILLSSHLLSDVQDVCDRVTILYGGQVRASGALDDLLSQKQVTQIVTPRLSSPTIDEIREVIRRRENSDDMEVSHPTERLEHYFVRIVEEAQAASIATSGVQAGGALADFLSESSGEQVIESLIEAGKPSPIPEPVVASNVPATGGGREVLDDLLEDRRSPSDSMDSKSQAPAVREVSSSGEVDRSVIDSLLGGAEEKRGE